MIPTAGQFHKAEQNAITELADRPQWVAWRYGPPRDTGKPAKQPINPHTGELASATDPDAWGSFRAAQEAVSRYGCAGIGFVFQASDPYCGVDLDDCLDPGTGELAAWAGEIIGELASYAEVSPSGTGVKIWVRGSKPGERHTKQHHGGKVEVYDRARFFTFTGQRLGNTNTIAERAEELREVYRKVFGPDQTPEARSGQRRTPQSSLADDSELLEKARTGGAEPRTFARLYDRGYDAGEDRSQKDGQLCKMLAYWTGKDAERMEHLFNQSALGQRKKWRTRADYRRDTIDYAIKTTRGTYDPDYGRPEKTTRDRIEQAARDALVFDWTGRGGDTDRDVFRALLRIAYKANSLTVGAGARELAENAGIGKNTANKSVQRLIDMHGLVERTGEASGTKSADYTLRLDRIKVDSQSGHYTYRHPSIESPSIDNNTREYRESVPPLSQTPGLRDTSRLRHPYSPPRKSHDKNGRPHPNYTGPPLKRLGKRAGHVLDLIYAATKPVHIKELSDLTGIRQNNLKARYIKRLIGAGLIEEDQQDVYTTPADIEERLQRELEDSGCMEAEQRQKERHDREREAYRTRKQTPAGRVLSQAEMDAERKYREALKSADGTTGELEHFHAPLTKQDQWGKPRRTCHMRDGIAVHDDPLCDDDCAVAFGTRATREQESHRTEAVA